MQYLFQKGDNNEMTLKKTLTVVNNKNAHIVNIQSVSRADNVQSGRSLLYKTHQYLTIDWTLVVELSNYLFRKNCKRNSWEIPPIPRNC